MENLDVLLEVLTLKVKKTAENLNSLKEENIRLKTELAYLQKERESNKKKISENAVLRDKNEQAAIRIERILKKIDTLKAG